MKYAIVGTAGHIDHGKTALVKALTGIDTDRLAEEKRRGITIDLGFAHLDLGPELRLGFVDVPGHERFVKNMLAGVGGIDLVLLVVAAGESVKPQTREHFEICRLLGIPRGVIALTKSDLTDPELIEVARAEVAELVAGSFLEDAPIVAVSALTGAGVPELRDVLALVACESEARDAQGHFRLPIDRVFSVKGFGTVVTGTLISGAVAREQEVELYPAGRRLRVRGVEAHGSRLERAVAGQRTALNLADIEAAGLRRGDVLSEPGKFHPVREIDCRLEMLASSAPLKHRAPVHFHAGTAEIEAEVRLPAGTVSIAPGDSGPARIVLREPALVLPGDRFIIRRFSPVVTIGGGVVIDIGPKAHWAARLAALAAADALARVGILVREAPNGMSMASLIARTGMTAHEIADAATAAPVIAIAAPEPWYVDRAWFDAARARAVEIVTEFHRQDPMQAGIARQDLRGRAWSKTPLAVFDALLAAAPELETVGEVVKLRGHQRSLAAPETEARAAIERAFERAGLTAPAVPEVLAASGVEAARARALLALLLQEKRLVRVSADLVFHQSAIDRLRHMLAAKRGARFNVVAFKEWTGVSRKYAIPLLEFLDRSRVTRREGDERVVL